MASDGTIGHMHRLDAAAMAIMGILGQTRVVRFLGLRIALAFIVPPRSIPISMYLELVPTRSARKFPLGFDGACRCIRACRSMSQRRSRGNLLDESDDDGTDLQPNFCLASLAMHGGWSVVGRGGGGVVGVSTPDKAGERKSERGEHPER